MLAANGGMWECRHCTTLNPHGNAICEACAKTRDVHDQDDAEVALDDDVDSELAAALHESKICHQEEEKRNAAERESRKNTPVKLDRGQHDQAVAHIASHLADFPSNAANLEGRPFQAQDEDDIPLLYDGTIVKDEVLNDFVDHVTAKAEKAKLKNLVQQAKILGSKIWSMLYFFVIRKKGELR